MEATTATETSSPLLSSVEIGVLDFLDSAERGSREENGEAGRDIFASEGETYLAALRLVRLGLAQKASEDLTAADPSVLVHITEVGLGWLEENSEARWLSPKQITKDTIQLGVIPMPASKDLKEGEVNRLKISVRYLKDGMGRQNPRGYYLTFYGETFDGTWCHALLMSDPSVYLLLEAAQRFAAKRLTSLATEAITTRISDIQGVINKAAAYYASKGA